MGIDTDAKLMVYTITDNFIEDLYKLYDYYDDFVEPNGMTTASPYYDAGLEDLYIGYSIDTADPFSIPKQVEKAKLNLLSLVRDPEKIYFEAVPNVW